MLPLYRILSRNAVIALIGLLLMGIIIDLGTIFEPCVRRVGTYIFCLGGNPQHDRIGFRYWKAPNGPMGHYLLDQVHNEHLSIFLGFWATLTNALFAYIGTELIGVSHLRGREKRITDGFTSCR